MKAFTQLGSYEGRGSMEGWLTRIATNTCLNILRSAKRRPELTVSDLTGAGTGTSQETTAALSPYSAEAVVFNQDWSDEMTDEQVLNAIYADEGEAR